jgi:hypothetical protein
MTRLTHAWRALEREQHLAVLAAVGLFISMFLPWYSKANTFIEHGAVKGTQTSLSAFQAFSFVEAAVLLVSAGVLSMLFARGEGRDFQLPGGDGLIVTVAGGWAALLIFYRLLDKPGLQASQRITATVGVEWGIFIALLLALGLLYAGQRMRAEARHPPRVRVRERGRADRSPPPEADRDGERGNPRSDAAGAETIVTPPRPRRVEVDDDRTRSTQPVPAREPDMAASRPSDPETEETSRTPPPPRRSSTPRPRYPPAPSEQMSFEDPPPAPSGE